MGWVGEGGWSGDSGVLSDGDYGDITISGSGTSLTVDIISTFGRTLTDDTSASAARTTLELGGSATLNVGTTAGTVAAGDHSHTKYPTWYVLAADATNDTTTPADLLMSFTPAADTTYVIEVFLSFYTAAQTTGLQWQLYDGSGATWSSMFIMSPSSATSQAISLGPMAAANNALGLGTKTGTSPSHLAYGFGTIKASSSPSGTVVVRFNSEVASSAVVVRAGSAMRVTAVA